MKWDEVKKFPWYTHRLTHRKRVTSELHDSYFRLMTIKHAISKIEWAIEWALNYYIAQSRQKSRQLQLSSSSSGRETKGGRESHIRPKGPSGALIELGSREERHNVDGHKNGGQNIAVSVRSPAPSHTQTLNNLFEPLQ